MLFNSGIDFTALWYSLLLVILYFKSNGQAQKSSSDITSGARKLRSMAVWKKKFSALIWAPGARVGKFCLKNLISHAAVWVTSAEYLARTDGEDETPFVWSCNDAAHSSPATVV